MSGYKLFNYPDRTSIEKRIATRQLSMTDAAKLVSQQTGKSCSKHSVSRHMKNYISSKLVKIANDIDQNEALNVVNSLTAGHDRVLTIYNEALADGDRKTALMAINIEIKLLDLSHKIGLNAQGAPKAPTLRSIEVRAAELKEFLEIETGYDVEKQKEIIGAVLKYATYRRNSQ